MRKVIIATASAAALFAVSGAAQAEAPAQVVSFAKVDFRDQTATQTFYERVRAAARLACRSPYIISTKTVENDRACVEDTVSDAVNTLNRPTLTAMHQQRDQFRNASK
jgi:UrcA family protein